MSEWKTDTLGKHCYIKARIGWRGLAASEYTESGPFLIAGKHIDGGRIDWDHTDHISEFRYNESSEIALAHGDLILSKDGTIGRVARVDQLPGRATINGTMMLVRPARGLNYRFLYHVLNGATFKKLVADKVSGSSIPHIFQRDMVTLPVTFPPMAYQTKLAEILDNIDIAIHETESIIAKLKAVKQGLLHDLLTRGIDANGELRPPQAEAPHLYRESPLGCIPKEWDVVFLDDVTVRGSGHTPSKSVPAYWSGGIKWVSLADSHRLDNIYIDETDKEISALGIANSSAVLHAAGTVILSRDAGVGKSAVLAGDMAVSQHFMAWRCGDRLSNLFLYFHLQREKPKFEAIALGSTIKTIGLPFFKSYQLAIPPRAEQELAVSALMEGEGNVATHFVEAAKLKELKAGLMDDLLTGRVRVTPLLPDAERVREHA